MWLPAGPVWLTAFTCSPRGGELEAFWRTFLLLGLTWPPGFWELQVKPCYGSLPHLLKQLERTQIGRHLASFMSCALKFFFQLDLQWSVVRHKRECIISPLPWWDLWAGRSAFRWRRRPTSLGLVPVIATQQALTGWVWERTWVCTQKHTREYRSLDLDFKLDGRQSCCVPCWREGITRIIMGLSDLTGCAVCWGQLAVLSGLSLGLRKIVVFYRKIRLEIISEGSPGYRPYCFEWVVCIRKEKAHRADHVRDMTQGCQGDELEQHGQS